MSDEKKNLFDKIKEINAAEREAEAERERIEAEERAAREKAAYLITLPYFFIN